MPDGAVYAGTYHNDDGFAFVVSAATDGLSLAFREGPPVLICPISDTEFRARTVNLDIWFERSDDGRVSAMTVVQGDKAIRVVRQAP
jgi:hypothetical protein